MHKHSLRLVKNDAKSLRELTQVEYQHLWPDQHRKPKKFEQFLIDYNKAKSNPLNEIYFTSGMRGQLPFTIVYRETLPQSFQTKLDEYEKTLPTPFVEGCKMRNNVITGRFKQPVTLEELSKQKSKW